MKEGSRNTSPGAFLFLTTTITFPSSKKSRAHDGGLRSNKSVSRFSDCIIAKLYCLSGFINQAWMDSNHQ